MVSACYIDGMLLLSKPRSSKRRSPHLLCFAYSLKTFWYKHQTIYITRQ